MERERLEDLILKHLEGGASEEELAALDAEVVRDPDAARLLRSLAEERLRLAEVLGRSPLSPADAIRRRRAVVAGRRRLAAAAIVLVAVGLWALIPMALIPGGPGRPRYVGDRLLVLGDEGDPVPAKELTPGVRHLARSGEVWVGATVVRILAPSVFTLESPGPAVGSRALALDSGRVRIEVRGTSPGFAVRTPRGVLRDLGTIFEVALNRPMEEAVMIAKVRTGSLPIFVLATVLAGKVAWTPVEGEERVIAPETGPVKLADDFALGRVSDREGLVFVRPVLGERWTLALQETPLEVGDWLKASPRGANAAEISLADGSRAILGPGGLLELVERGRLRLLSGEMEVRPRAAGEVEVRPRAAGEGGAGAAAGSVIVEGPGDASVTVDAPRILRATAGDAAGPGKLLTLDAEPRWLSGFKAKASTEALGSLLAQVDGRSEPLTIGYHKVTVDIRDQIARTVVEESFINHTSEVLEGVFYFPLPQEASISGFGMWIGGELVEADIVEKERAREIYEEILREKRDPGLLEWTGGNIFKARVYPIPLRGEKRIRIEYTQVLPRSGSAYRYTYPLRSEMLEKHPLRELQIAVTVSSAERLAAVGCPSHPARVRKTEHAATVEFAAEEHTPRRDFEVVVETGAPVDAPGAPSGGSPGDSAPGRPGPGGRVVVVPHRRGDDGYLLVLLSAGGCEGRRLVPGGDPLEIVIVADTSASMTDEQIREERLFVSSLIEALGEKDRFALLAFDADLAWAFPEPVPATAENRARALEFLERRGALGWTDLERALGEVMKGLREGTHVVYVGDGIPSMGDADPAALAGRLRRLHRGAGSFHAVGVGSTYDLTVLGAIASLGAGSLHRTGGGKDAALVASELLEEIASPGLRDVTLQWRGIRVAAVYPEVLPNLPAGREQIVLGRYLPEGKELRGSLRVTALLEGKPWSAEVPVALAADEEGNAFIPRFWARLHLDRLLAEGQTQEVKERVVALSEDYQIITPYTSLLVLESDADRERFRVKRRLRMRGGEEFFAEGREAASYEIAREQILRARLWRARLRERTLALYAGMGRDLGPGAPSSHVVDRLGRESWEWGRELSGLAAGFGGRLGELAPGDRGAAIWFEDPSGSVFVGDGAVFAVDHLAVDSFGLAPAGGAAPLALAESVVLSFSGEPADELLGFADGDLDPVFDTVGTVMSHAVPVSGPTAERFYRGDCAAGLAKREDSFFAYARRPAPPGPPFRGVFPEPGAPIGDADARWPAEIRALVDALDGRAASSRLPGGLRIAIEQDSTDHRGRIRPGTRGTYLLSPSAWAARTEGFPGDAPRIEWVRGGERGALDAARLLASRRAAKPRDAMSWPAPIAFVFDDLERTHSAHVPSLSREGGRATLKLVPKRSGQSELRILVDLERSTILEVSWLARGKVLWTWTFGDFEGVAGRFLPRKVEFRDAEGRVTLTTRVSYEDLAADAFARALDEALAPLGDSVILDLPLPKVDEAKRRAAEGKATLADRWVLLGRHAAIQEWDRVREHHAALEAIAGGEPGADSSAIAAGKPGLAWIRLEVLLASRRNDEARSLGLALAARLAERSAPGDLALARALEGRLRNAVGAAERIRLVESLEPVLLRQDARLFPGKEWKVWLRDALRALGRREEAMALAEELAGGFPDDADLQADLANALVERGELDRAVERLERAREEHGPWTDAEAEGLRARASEILRGARRLADFLAFVDRWVAEAPEKVPGYVLDRSLSALVMLDREAEADERIAAWLDGARGDEPSPLERARLGAAISHALNRGADLYSSREVDPRWRKPLADLARRFAAREEGGELAGRIIEDGRFRETAEARALRGELYATLADGLDSLAPEVLRNLCRWLRNAGHSPGESAPSWEDIARRLLARWEREAGSEDRERIEGAISACGAGDAVVALLRRKLALAEDDEERAAAAWRLFEALRPRPWTPELERELLDLLSRVGGGRERALVQARAAAAIVEAAGRGLSSRRIEEIPDRSRKTRRELLPLEEEARKKALGDLLEVIGRLEAAAREAGRSEGRNGEPGSGRPASGVSGAIDPRVLPFVAIERLAIEARLRTDPAGTFAALRSLLGQIPPPEPDDADPADPLGPALDGLAERCALTMGYLATVKDTDHDADAKLAEDLLAMLDDLIAKDAGEPRSRLDAKRHKHLLLVALDRGDALEGLLRAWAEDVGDVPANPWKVSLGYLLAERGKLAEAVEVFESVERIDELGAAEYAALAGWRHALDRAEARREARIRAHEKTDEWRIQQSLRNDLGRYRRAGGGAGAARYLGGGIRGAGAGAGAGGVPEDLDDDILLRFAALLRKSGSPESHVWLLRQYYEATKDFRLLESLPEAVVGQSAGKVYAFLGSLGSLLELVGDEATIDRMVGRLRVLREPGAGGAAPSAVDRRALLLLELLVERRGADQAHGAGPHLDRAAAALEEAFSIALAEGEPVLAAGFLRSLGGVVDGLRGRVLDRLRTLHDEAAPGSEDRFRIGAQRALSLWANGLRTDAVSVLEAAIGEWRTPREGRAAPSVGAELETLASWREELGEFRAAEAIWRRELETAPNEERRRWAEARLFASLERAFERGGATSLGGGPGGEAALYAALRRDLLAALERRTSEGHAAWLVSTLCAMFRAARGKVEGAERDLAGFAYETFPRVLGAYQHRDAPSMVRAVGEALKGEDDWMALLEFLVTRAEGEPRWLERADGDFWRHHGVWLAEARSHLGNPGALSTRVLGLYLKELRRDLRHRAWRSRHGYDERWTYWWKERADDFFRVAGEALDELRGSEPHVIHIAEYLHDGIGRKAEAVDALHALYRQGSLGQGGRERLVRFLFDGARHAEAVPILLGLVEEAPDRAAYRGDLMRAVMDAGDRAKVLEILRAADAHFRAEGRWSEGVAATLARASLDAGSWKGRVDRELLEKALGFFDEAINLRARTAPGRGVGEGTLATYYAQKAEAYGHLGDVARAVDAAAGAVVSWGPRQEERKAAKEALLRVLRGAKDLDGYAAGFEAELSKEGLENPLVREAIGKVYLEREEFAKAARQLEAAVEGGPVEAETYRAYLEALDRGGKAEEATARLWRLARLRGHELALYEELGVRLERAGDAAPAERAYTSLAELSANESEGRAMLAGVRERQGRFLEAAEEWRQVIRVRSKEPTGYLGAARSLIGAGKGAEAEEVLRTLRRQGWHPRFDGVEEELRELEEKARAR